MADMISMNVGKPGFEVMVHPKHLGPVKVIAKETEAGIKLEIAVRDPVAASLIRQHLPVLQARLDSQGNPVDVEVSAESGSENAFAAGADHSSDEGGQASSTTAGAAGDTEGSSSNSDSEIATRESAQSILA
ncbi:flagellar hook-length control protein FliK [Ferrimonas marina]|nr:flagellar hook-length control protein FliK [Ferrimonas marina]